MLQDSTRLEYRLGAGVGAADELVGTLLPASKGVLQDAEGADISAVVKAWLPATREYLLCNVNGFRCAGVPYLPLIRATRPPRRPYLGAASSRAPFVDGHVT